MTTVAKNKPKAKMRRVQARPGARARPEDAQHKQARVRKIVRTLDQTYPRTGLALNFGTPLDLLIALILAAQCTDERVNLVTAELFKKYKTAKDWADLDRSQLEAEIRTTGFYRNKAKSIQACCHALLERFAGKVPERLEDLLTLPGVGRKTANILRGSAFGQAAIGVDTHVGRLAQRLGLSDQTDPNKIEFDLNPIVPDEVKVEFCRLIQAHGRAVCTARKPNCPDCVINAVCPYPG